MSNSVAIVTGASQGIGRATAIRLAKDFGFVVLVARNAVNLEMVAAEVERAGARALVIGLDLAEPRRLRKSSTRRFRPLDVSIPS